jgi:hypothetical protein
VRRWPVVALAALAIALAALTVVYILAAVKPAVPAVLTEGETFSLPAGGAYFIQGTGKDITISSNVTITAAYAQMGAAIAVNRLPVNVSLAVGSYYVANVTTPDGRVWYPVVQYGLSLSGYSYNVCFNGSMTPLPNGLYLIAPGPWYPPSSAHVAICRVAHSGVNRLFTGDLSYDGTYIYISNVDTSLASYTNYLSTYKASAVNATQQLRISPSPAVKTVSSMKYGYVHLIAMPWHVIALVPTAPAQVAATATPWP